MWFVAFVGAGCGPSEVVSLVDLTTWTRDVVDPAPSHDVGAACADDAVVVEDGRLEIRTQTCAYAVLGLEVAADVRRNDLVRVRWWHSALFADDAAEGHFLLAHADGSLVDTVVPIPQAYAGFHDELVAPPGRIRAGDTLVLHVHNHGANTWTLEEVSVGW